MLLGLQAGDVRSWSLPLISSRPRELSAWFLIHTMDKAPRPTPRLAGRINEVLCCVVLHVVLCCVFGSCRDYCQAELGQA